jgi:hypothetical protein
MKRVRPARVQERAAGRDPEVLTRGGVCGLPSAAAGVGQPVDQADHLGAALDAEAGLPHLGPTLGALR